MIQLLNGYSLVSNYKTTITHLQIAMQSCLIGSKKSTAKSSQPPKSLMLVVDMGALVIKSKLLQCQTHSIGSASMLLKVFGVLHLMVNPYHMIQTQRISSYLIMYCTMQQTTPFHC